MVNIPVEMADLAAVFNNRNFVLSCACSDGSAVFEMGDRQFVGQFNGAIAVRLGRAAIDKASSMRVPLHIVGYSTQSQIEGLGLTSLDFDYSRTVRPSEIRGTPIRFFPAIQTMRLNILMTAEALGGVTLRSRNVGTLVNGKVSSFPPKPGATYVLQKPVELEDVNKPGEVQARLVSVNTRITATEMPAKVLSVGSGVHFKFHGDSNDRVKLALQLDRGANVALKVLNSKGAEVGELLKGRLSEGTHEVPIERSGIKGKNLYYQLFLDGRISSAPIPLPV